jgi:hypothetical protein
MIRLDAERAASFCNGVTRRDFLHAGALPLVGLTLPGLFARRAAAAETDEDVNCIMLFLVGAPSHIDTFDPKPDAPEEVRGPFKPIATNVTGLRVSEIFPKTARHADKTGRLFTGGVEHPHAGCVLTYLKGQRGEVPGNVLIPRPIGRTGGNLPHGHTAGYLGRQHDPFILNADPSDKHFTVPDLLPPDYLSAVRAERRQKMRDAVDGAVASFEKQAQAKQMDDNFHLAYRLMSSPRAREAFALDKEPDATRDRYGRTRFGQSCLLARRLIERGVRFVTVNMFETVFDEITWDIHGSKPFTDITEMSRLVAPNFDQAYSTLLEDLHDRGLLKKTMVTALGEFGRTPKINPAGGRDHHPGVWTVLMGGGPIKGGRVVGESDELGYVPKTRPVTPGEIVATIFRGLGLDPHHELPGPQGRPLPLVEFGVQPIKELF